MLSYSADVILVLAHCRPCVFVQDLFDGVISLSVAKERGMDIPDELFSLGLTFDDSADSDDEDDADDEDFCTTQSESLAEHGLFLFGNFWRKITHNKQTRQFCLVDSMAYLSVLLTSYIPWFRQTRPFILPKNKVLHACSIFPSRGAGSVMDRRTALTETMRRNAVFLIV